MNDLSLRQSFQYIDAGPNDGVRKYAPNRDPISLRQDFSITNPFPMRRVLHLSDLHIGMNRSEIPWLQAQKVIDGIIKTYEFENPKPIVVITGDLVDHHSSDNLTKAFDLLQKLETAFFTVLVIPGNHDYSNAFDITQDFSELKKGFDPVGICQALTALIALIGAWKAGKDGYDLKLVSGMSYDLDAYTAFQDKFANYMHGGFFRDSRRDEGARFDLDFILLDGQDHHCRRATDQLNGDVTWTLQIHKRFYLHDNTRHGNPVDAGRGDLVIPSTDKSGIRWDLGWLEDYPNKDGLGSAEVGVGFFNNMVQQSMNNQSVCIVAIHYPLKPRDHGWPGSHTPWSHGFGNENGHYLVNEPDLFSSLDNCHALLVGHTHLRRLREDDPSQKDYSPYNDRGELDPGKNSWFNQGFNDSTHKKQYYCVAGATFPDNKNGNWGTYDPRTNIEKDTQEKLVCRTWVELNINLQSDPNSVEITASARDCDGSKKPPSS